MCGHAKRSARSRAALAMRSRRRQIECEQSQRLGESERVARRDEQAVAAVAHDVAIAGDVRGYDRLCRGERLGQDHAEALSVQRGRAQHLGARELLELALLGDLAERLHAAVVEHHVGDLLGPRADERQRRRDVLAQGLEGAQQDGQALAFDRLPDEQQAQRLGLTR